MERDDRRNAAGRRQRLGRCGLGGVLVGTAAGLVLSLVFDIAAKQGDRECANATGVCFGTAPFVGLAIGFAAILAICWIGFKAVGTKPLVIAVTCGIFIPYPIARFGHVSFASSYVHPLWLFVAEMALAYGALALALSAPTRDETSRPR